MGKLLDNHPVLRIAASELGINTLMGLEQGGMTVAGAEDYVKQMKKDRRYLRDVY